jgi:transcriptional regulator GlxA family with amidase domain
MAAEDARERRDAVLGVLGIAYVGAASARSGVAERSFKRRFTQATGVSPLEYVQRLRVEYAKRRLEQSDVPIDEVSWKVGYEDPASFRRLFRRVTGVAPGIYRRRYRVPGSARAAVAAQRKRSAALSQ